MTIGDVYQLKTIYVYSAQQCMNVYWYGHSAGAGVNVAQKVVDFFLADLYPAIQDIQAAGCLLTQVDVVNWGRPADFASATPSTTGTHIGGFDQPPEVAVGLRSPKSAPGTRYSYKRIPGVMLDLTSGGSIDFTSGDDEILNAIASALGSIETVTGDTFVPVQVRTVPPPPLGTLPVIQRGLTGSWSFNTFPTTQNSRKNYSWL